MNYTVTKTENGESYIVYRKFSVGQSRKNNMKTRHGYIEERKGISKVKETFWLTVCAALVFSVFIFGFYVGTA